MVKKSGIKGAGVGVWTLVDLPECLIFGPITGDKVDPEEDIDRIYSWDVSTTAVYMYTLIKKVFILLLFLKRLLSFENSLNNTMQKV